MLCVMYVFDLLFHFLGCGFCPFLRPQWVNKPVSSPLAGFQVPALAGGDHRHLPAVQQAGCGAAGAQTGAGGLLDGLPGGGHQERRLLSAVPCKLLWLGAGQANRADREGKQVTDLSVLQVLILEPTKVYQPSYLSINNDVDDNTVSIWHVAPDDKVSVHRPHRPTSLTLTFSNQSNIR